MTTKPDIRITKCKNTRFYAVWLDGELLAVVCYKKGGLAIKHVLLDAISRSPKSSRGQAAG